MSTVTVVSLWRGISRPAAFWAGFAVLVAVSWAVLLALSLQPAPQTGIVARLLYLCSTALGVPGFLALAGMWGVMTLAMMGPVAAPYIASYATLGRAGDRQPPALHLWCLAVGYLAVWTAYAMAAAALQYGLAASSAVDFEGRLGPVAAVSLLAAAAAYQVSPLKSACLARCQAPFSFFFANWRPGPLGAMAMGLRQGAVCVACCWAIMLLAFVAGTMNVVWMAAATMLMLLERLKDPRGTLRRMLAALLAAGAVAGGLRVLGVL